MHYTGFQIPDGFSIFTTKLPSLIAEGYTMSAFDNCLFYRITPTETTYIIVYVDDTFIFSNSQANTNTVIKSIGKHYEVTLEAAKQPVS